MKSLSSKTFKLCSTKKIMFKWVVYFTFIENIVHLLSFCWWSLRTPILTVWWKTDLETEEVLSLHYGEPRQLCFFFFFPWVFVCMPFYTLLSPVTSCYTSVRELFLHLAPPLFWGWRAFSLGHLQSQGNWKSGYC